MSNSVSSGINAGTTGKKDTKQRIHMPPPGARQQAFKSGTMGMLDDARQMVENAAGQGMELNPLIYQMLGLNPQMEDHSAELTAAQQEMDTSQKQYDEAKTQLDQLKGIPQGKRTDEQKKQFKTLKKGVDQMGKSLADTRNNFNRLQTMPKTITGFDHMDPNAIPKESPFSAQNPLNQAQATESQRLNQYLAGGEVDPTLKHQYDQAEQQLRAKLSQRFGADFESTSVGQMALQNFSRQKNEAFATYNQSQVEKYNALAFQGQANLQQLLSNQIGLMREPSHDQMNAGAQLSNVAQTRLSEQSLDEQARAARAGVSVNTITGNPIGAIGGGLGNLANMAGKAYDAYQNRPASIDTVQVPQYGSQAGSSALTNWATGAGAGAGADSLAAYNAGTAGTAASMLGTQDTAAAVLG